MSKAVTDRIWSNMVEVKGGIFRMGPTEEQIEENVYENAIIRYVKLDSFMLCRFPVTQREWQVLIGHNPSQFRWDLDLPVECISWEEADFFITHLNSLTSGGYRLPTEAEWEYAARGGNKSLGYKFSGSNQIDEVAWTERNSSSKTHPVGQFKPNELGLYDMSGNVREWCWDFYDTYKSFEMINPQGPGWGDHRVQRGGSWNDDPSRSLVSFRLMEKPQSRLGNCGFRLAFQVEGKKSIQNNQFIEKLLKS